MANLALILYVACFINTVLFVWFKTNAFVEYCKLLCFESLIVDYLNTDGTLTYPQFLYLKTKTSKNRCVTFLGALVTCPVCLMFWLCILCLALHGTFFLLPVLYVCCLLMYAALNYLY